MADLSTHAPAPDGAAPAAVQAPLELPPRDLVDIWTVRLEQFGGIDFHAVLGGVERAGAAANPERAATRAATRILLARYCGTSPAETRFSISQFGKPELLGSRLSFSVARRRGLALIAVAGEGRLGVDLEMRRPLPELDGICTMLHPAERALLAATPESAREDRFYRVWTRKEAALKALGTGMADGLAGFSVVGERAYLPGAPPLALHDVAVAEGWFAACATEPGVTGMRLFVMPPPEALRRPCP